SMSMRIVFHRRWLQFSLALVLAFCLVRPVVAQQAQPLLSAQPTPVSQNVPNVTDNPPAAESTTYPPEPGPQKHPFGVFASWDNGLQFETENKEVRLHFGGTGQLDTVGLIGPQSLFTAPGGSSSNGVGNAQATQLRRAILAVDGTFYQLVDFMLQYDFANASNDNSGV